MGFMKVRVNKTLIMANVFLKNTEANLNEKPRVALLHVEGIYSASICLNAEERIS